MNDLIELRDQRRAEVLDGSSFPLGREVVEAIIRLCQETGKRTARWQSPERRAALIAIAISTTMLTRRRRRTSTRIVAVPRLRKAASDERRCIENPSTRRSAVKSDEIDLDLDRPDDVTRLDAAMLELSATIVVVQRRKLLEAVAVLVANLGKLNNFVLYQRASASRRFCF
jgi:hypothetical protein